MTSILDKAASGTRAWQVLVAHGREPYEVHVMAALGSAYDGFYHCVYVSIVITSSLTACSFSTENRERHARFQLECIRYRLCLGCPSCASYGETPLTLDFAVNFCLRLEGTTGNEAAT